MKGTCWWLMCSIAGAVAAAVVAQVMSTLSEESFQ